MYLLPRIMFFRPRQPFVFNVAIPCLLNFGMIHNTFGVRDGFRLVLTLVPIGIRHLPDNFRKEFGNVILVAE